MGNVLIRDVPEPDMSQLRRAAEAAGISMQAYLLATLHERAVWEQRRLTLAEVADDLSETPELSAEDRAAARRAIDHALDRGE